MTTQLMLIIGAVIIIAAITIGILTALDVRSERAKGNLAAAAAARDVQQRSKRRTHGIPWSDRHVAPAGIDVSGRTWFALVALACVLVGVVAHGALGTAPVTLLAVLGTAAASELYLAFKKKSRARMFDEQLARALPQIAQNLRAGVSAERALRSVAENSPEPLASELRRVSAEASITADLASAFDALSDRTSSKDVLLIATAVRIVKTQGGSLSDILENVAGVLESRQEMVRYADSQTAATKITAVLLIVMTVAIAVMQGFMQDGYLDFYRDTIWGWIVIAVVVALEIAGYAIICKISDVKVD